MKQRERRQNELKLQFGSANYNSMKFLFVLCDEWLMTSSSFTWKFRRVIRENNLRATRFHYIRHAFATLLLKEWASIENVQNLLGHSNISTTVDIYRHVDIEDKKMDTNILSAALKAG